MLCQPDFSASRILLYSSGPLDTLSLDIQWQVCTEKAADAAAAADAKTCRQQWGDSVFAYYNECILLCGLVKCDSTLEFPTPQQTRLCLNQYGYLSPKRCHVKLFFQLILFKSAIFLV
jgi:hypothetical protein